MRKVTEVTADDRLTEIAQIRRQLREEETKLIEQVELEQIEERRREIERVIRKARADIASVQKQMNDAEDKVSNSLHNLQEVALKRDEILASYRVAFNVARRELAQAGASDTEIIEAIGKCSGDAQTAIVCERMAGRFDYYLQRMGEGGGRLPKLSQRLVVVLNREEKR